MADEFERRLDETNARARAAREQADAASAKQAAERTQRDSAVQAAISDWNGRIAPTVATAMAIVNDRITDTGLHLGANATGGANAPPLPGIQITALSPPAGPSPRTRTFVPAGHQLQMSVNSEGKISISSNTKMPPVEPIAAAALSEDKIKSIIADFVDFIVPR